jgi:hypothetical protein
MDRVVLDDGRWFDAQKARKFQEGKRFDGRNMISLATGSQWEHELLFRTAGGVWVLNRYSAYQGTSESWTEVSAGEAARWLVRNEHEVPSDGAADVKAVAAEYAALEVL